MCNMPQKSTNNCSKKKTATTSTKQNNKQPAVKPTWNVKINEKKKHFLAKMLNIFAHYADDDDDHEYDDDDEDLHRNVFTSRK